jgi:hypothetical protein
MISIDDVEQIVTELNSHRKATFAEFIYSVFKDQYVEVYLGDSYENVNTDQVSTPYPAVFSGKVIGAYRECLVLQGTYIDRKTKTIKHGKQVFINERAIRGLCEVDGQGVMDDIFLRSRDATRLKSLVSEK